MHTYIDKIGKDIVNLNTYSDGTASILIWRSKTNTWQTIGEYTSVEDAFAACRNLK